MANVFGDKWSFTSFGESHGAAIGGILDGTTNFTSSRIKLLINYGYEDTVKILEQNGYFPVSNFWFE